MTSTLNILRIVAIGLAWFGAAALFTLAPAVGSIASIIATVIVVLLAPASLSRPTWARLSRWPLAGLALAGVLVLDLALIVEIILAIVARPLISIEVIEVTITLLLVAAVATFPASWATLRQQPAVLMFLAAFVSITICFAATARELGDTLFFTNFVGLLLAPVVYLLALKRPGARTIAVLAALLALGAVVGGLVGYYDVFVQHQERATGWGSGGNLLARTVVLLGFMAPVGILALRSPWRWLLLIGTAASLYALYLTETRGVFVAVPFLGLLFVWALLREVKASRAWYIAGSGGLAVAVAGAIAISPRFLGILSLVQQAIFNPSAIPDLSTTERIEMWQVGWRAFLRSPLIGHGWAHLAEAARPYVLTFYHNDFFDAAVAAGIVGIVAWFATVIAPIVGVFAMPRDRFSNVRLYCALVLSVSFFIFGLTDMTFGYDLPTTLHAFLTAIVLGAFREPEPPEINRAG